MSDDSVLGDDLKNLLQVMADPCGHGALKPRERRAITQALNEIHGWREKDWDARHPGPGVSSGPDRGTIDDMAKFNGMARKLAEARADVSRLLAAAKYFRRGRECYCDECKMHAAVIADHEAAAKGGGVVAGMEALREAGGRAWDDVADPGAYLHGPDVSRLVAAAKEAIADLDRISMAIESDLGPGTYCENIHEAIRPLRDLL